MNKEMDKNIKIKCHKCKSKNIDIIELSTDFKIIYNYDTKTKKYSENGFLEPGESDKVRGRCNSCHHVWTIRKASTIEDLDIIQDKKLNW